jgi:hypothetical protein
MPAWSEPIATVSFAKAAVLSLNLGESPVRLPYVVAPGLVLQAGNNLPKWLFLCLPNKINPALNRESDMKQILRAIFWGAAMLSTNMAQAAEPVQVMVLGAYHFGNPGKDLNNAKVDDVMAPKRQAELAEVIARLARFKPTKIMVEMSPTSEDFTIAEYRTRGAEVLATDRNEIVQIGYRLALKLGHKDVYAVDEQSNTVDYFPFDKVQAGAATYGQSAQLAPLMAQGATWVKDFETAQKIKSIRQLLIGMNAPNYSSDEMRDFYYPMLQFGKGADLPGADLNAAWYLRNAKIFGKVMQVAKSGDRVVLLYGAGHVFWLKHLAAHTPGYTLVEANIYLK